MTSVPRRYWVTVLQLLSVGRSFGWSVVHRLPVDLLINLSGPPGSWRYYCKPADVWPTIATLQWVESVEMRSQRCVEDVGRQPTTNNFLVACRSADFCPRHWTIHRDGQRRSTSLIIWLESVLRKVEQIFRCAVRLLRNIMPSLRLVL